MKQFVKLLLVLVLCPTLVQATSLDGTSSIVYQDKHYVFRNFNTAKGYVRLNNGFTILAGQSVGLDTFVTVSGAIDLRTTGSLDLRGDLFLDQHVTWSSSGKIYGRGNTIHLGGSLSLPTDTVLQFIDDTIIDGDGHTLTLGAHAQLLLASDVSLTLKNMILKTTRNSSHIPIIRCFDQKSHVTLDNVELALTDDFAFRTGRMFFKNDVVVTGTSCFIYQSWMQGYVASQSLLTFDPGTTLYYYPSTPDKDLIQLQSKSAGIYLKGSATTLQTTHTGMRLSKGRMWLDNKVTVSTRANTDARAFTQVATASYGTQVDSIDWSKDGRYLAVGGVTPTNGMEFQIYKFDGSSLTYVTGDNWTGGGAEVYMVRWHPNGQLVAAVGDATNDVRIYRFDGTTLTTIVAIDLSGVGFVKCVEWHPSGEYILFGIDQDEFSSELRIYSFKANKLTFLDSDDMGTSGGPGLYPKVNDCSWHPRGTHFMIACSNQVDFDQARLYSFNGSSITLVSTQDNGNSGVSTEFMPDGSHFVFAQVNAAATAYVINLFRFNTTSFTLVDTLTYGGEPYVRWSPDGQNLVVGGAFPSSGGELKLYQFTRPSTLTEVSSVDYGAGGASINSVAWSRDSKYVAIGGDTPGAGHDEIEVYSVYYRFDSTTQALTNGLTLGKSASGASFDLDTYVLSGATVNLAGQLFYDSTS